jgi:DNA polymerase (family 10)
VLSSQGLRFDLRVVPPECYGNLLQHFTGSKLHNMALREDAVRHGFSVSEYGVKVVETGEVATHAEESDLYELLGYQFIPPELRENLGELEAARLGSLPALVDLGDLRGDLHSHTTWSADGKASAEEMATAARARGYRYLAVTDHSHYLREGRMEAQDAELDALNERLAPFRLLKGVEANIRANGQIDVPDDVLATREWVIASLHTSFDKNPTERVIGAMEHPHVHCIGHLTGRKIGRRAGAAIDVARVVEKALETGTCLEIDSQPDRLDMPDTVARLAGEAGVPIAVTSDAHRLSALAYVELGIGQARRAWLTKQHVLNTRTWAQVEKVRK